MSELEHSEALQDERVNMSDQSNLSNSEQSGDAAMMKPVSERSASLQSMQQWRDSYQSQLTPSPLEDITQLSAQLELTHAHPSGIAQLFASGKVTLPALFRDSGMLRAAGRRLERVFEDRDAKAHQSGVSELSLIVGVASWKGNRVPVLTYPVQVQRNNAHDETAATIYFAGNVRLNHALVARLRDRGVLLSEDDLFDGSHYESGTPETTAVFAAICHQARVVFPDFDIERDIVLGCFTDAGARFVAESDQILEALKQGNVGNVMIDALAGDESARKTLRADSRAEFSPFDVDPHTEYGVGDVDNQVRYVASLAARGTSVFVNVGAGVDTATTAAAIASRSVLAGRSVLYVSNVVEQQRRFRHVLSAHEIAGLSVDVADTRAGQHVDNQLIAAVGSQESVASSRYDQVADELVGVRARLTRYLGDLHSEHEQWHVSAYQTIQNLASIAMLPSHPSTHVRLDTGVARALAGHLDQWAAKLHEADSLGEFTTHANDTPWFGASIFDEHEAVNVYQHVVDVLLKVLPATREQVKKTVQSCGFPVPHMAREWGHQVTVLKNLRRVLDVFQPEIFERDLKAMIEASKPKSVRKREGTVMGFWERRHYLKEARKLLRVGAKVEDLHESLKVVAQQAKQWRVLVPHGGWPVLPSQLDEIVDTQAMLAQHLVALDNVLASTREGGDLETVEFSQLDARLRALHDDRAALDNLPGRCCLEREFNAAGLGDLVIDLRRRNVTGDALDGELQLAWWTTVFEDIVRSSAIISNQDGSAMQDAADRFMQVDTEHVRSIGPMVQQETLKRLRDLLFARTQEANQLHTLLASSRSDLSLSQLLHRYADLVLAAKPIITAVPSTLTMMTQFEPIVDLVILDSAEHMANIELLSIMARARQIVILAHKQTVSCESVRKLIALLPEISVSARASRRSLRLSMFLEEHGYGTLRHDVPVERLQGKVRLHQIDATGVPVMSSGLIESSQREIDEVVALIKQRAQTFSIVSSSYSLVVVTLTDVFRARLGAELKSLALKDENMARFLRHVRLVGVRESVGVNATDVILSLSYAKTSHGRLLQQFGVLEEEGGQGMLLDALALTRRHLDIVAAFTSQDMDDERLHQDGPKLLKQLLIWAEHLSEEPLRPEDLIDESMSSVDSVYDNVLFMDLADRLRARGLRVAVYYGIANSYRIPLAVGLPDKPFALAVLTDDDQCMSIQSARERHRMVLQDLETLGWSTMTVWSVSAFVNPEKEVDRIVSQLSELYGDEQ